MLVSVKKTSNEKEINLENQPFSWLNVIMKLRSIFILGCKGQERYELFSSCLSPLFCLQEVWGNLQEDRTYVLYPSLTNELYVKRDDQQIERCENFLNEKTDVVLFVPVDPSQLPNGSLIVLPPAMLEKEISDIMMDSLFCNERTEYVWVEAFPYGKGENFNALLHLEKQCNVRKQNIHLAFIESQRRFAYTDLDTLHEAIEIARQNYYNRGYVKTIATIPGRLSPFALLSLITEDAQYTEGLCQEVLGLVKRNKRYYENFFEELYLDMVADLQLPTMLEEIFDYHEIKRVNKNTVFDSWLHQMNELVFRQLQIQIQKLLSWELKINTVYPFGDYQKFLDNLLQVEWTNFLKELSKEREQAKKIEKNLEAVQYAMVIKEVKVELKQKMTTYIEQHLFSILYNHVQFVYSLWDKIDEVER